MRAKILTLRYSSQLGRFDDGPLVSLQQKVVLEHVREHVVQIADEAMLVCVATWREQQQQQQQQQESPATTAAAPAPVAVAEPADGNGTPRPKSSGPARPVGELRAELDEQQRTRFDRLRAWRSKTAHDEGAPPYVILTNRQLVELVLQRPESKAGIARIHGLGDKKVSRHGDAILQLLWASEPASDQVAAEPGPPTEPTPTMTEATP